MTNRPQKQQKHNIKTQKTMAMRTKSPIAPLIANPSISKSLYFPRKRTHDPHDYYLPPLKTNEQKKRKSPKSEGKKRAQAQ